MFIRTERSVREFIHFYPIVTTILLINFILWIFTGFFRDSIGGLILTYGIGFNLSIYVDAEYWRLITPIFLHANIGHVLFNSFALVLFGPALERMTGKLKFTIIYLATGIIGNIGTYIIDVKSITPHLGASGAIYGLFGIYIYMSFARRDLIDQQSAQIVRTIFIIGLVMTFIRPNINIAAHLFGFVGGLFIGPLLLKNARPFFKPTYRRKVEDGEIAFDPNRWKKRRLLPKKVRDNWMWIVLIVVVIIYLVAENQ